MSEVIGVPIIELCGLFEKAAGGKWKVIIANQDGPIPSKPYITVRNTESSAAHHFEQRSLSDVGIGEFNAPAKQMLELESYGPGAKATLDRITAKLRLPSFSDELSSLNISFAGPLTSTDLSRLLMDSQTEERAMAELSFNFTQQLSDEVGLIDTIVVRAQFEY
jgi:hypothetical protein